MLTYLPQFLSQHLVAVGLVAAVLGLAWFVFRLYRRWNLVFGRNAKTSEQLGAEFGKRLAAAEAKLRGLEPRIGRLEAVAPRNIQKVGFLRFNPFERTGGDQSFVVALLDHTDSGVVISSLYTREGVRIYAKEITHGESKHQLSGEERSAITQAQAGAMKHHED